MPPAHSSTRSSATTTRSSWARASSGVTRTRRPSVSCARCALGLEQLRPKSPVAPVTTDCQERVLTFCQPRRDGPALRATARAYPEPAQTGSVLLFACAAGRDQARPCRDGWLRRLHCPRERHPLPVRQGRDVDPDRPLAAGDVGRDPGGCQVADHPDDRLLRVLA